ncbi:TPA: IS3 family transposase [Vibrio campbellii]|nr:IS3 family transposase [Vibrio campbellii]
MADIMKEKGIRARNGKGFKYIKDVAAMTNVADNLLRRDLESETPNQKWVTDITYIWVKSRWLFLATVMDLHSRRIVGWSLGTMMTVELITNALKMAFESRKPPKGVLIHSDRGVQYRAYKYQDFMRKHGGVPSMSRQGNCWDNAVIETAGREALVAGAGIGGGIAGGAIAGLACGPGAPACVSVEAFIGGTLAAFGMSIAW